LTRENAPELDSLFLVLTRGGNVPKCTQYVPEFHVVKPLLIHLGHVQDELSPSILCATLQAMQSVVEVFLEFLDHIGEGQLRHHQLGGRDLFLLLEHQLLGTVLESELASLAVFVEFLYGFRGKSVLSGGILLVRCLDEFD
jgi:hypothetical protein